MRGDDGDPRGLGDDKCHADRGSCTHRSSGEDQLAAERHHIGDYPGAKSNRTSGVPLTWLSEHWKTCPQGADEATVELYARAYLWYILSEVVFPDSSGNSANWAYLFFLAAWDAGYSWGTASLAYLYRSVREDLIAYLPMKVCL